MREVILAAAAFALLLTGPAQANGRKPCDRGAGGVSHCEGGKFICNNGTVSRSKQVCVAAGAKRGTKTR